MYCVKVTPAGITRFLLKNTSFSRCSTVLRNTVVRATIKVNGKPQILGTRSPQTPESIYLKFNLDDYVGGLILRAKNVQIGPAGSAGHKGEI